MSSAPAITSGGGANVTLRKRRAFVTGVQLNGIEIPSVVKAELVVEPDQFVRLILTVSINEVNTESEST